jgi:DNA polymerase elongation subunit (family B)
MAPALVDLRHAFAPLVCEAAPYDLPKRGRPPLDRKKAMTNAEQHRRCRAGDKASKLRNIAVLDFETDPFDDALKAEILPFVCELYSDQFGSIVIWDEDFERFIKKVVTAIEDLPDAYTIYAHNGGKFDYLFLVRHLRGTVKFKGRAIMSCRIGNHELRDSLHILPEKLAAWKKDHFDYSKMKRGNRAKFRDEILAYLHSDCLYLFDIIKSFISEFGLKISIGQAAFAALKKEYKNVAMLGGTKYSDTQDEFLRRYFFGGRVECIGGRGIFDSREGIGDFKLYDVNSMYPYVMANFAHPIGREYNWRRGGVSSDTVFIDVECENAGAFVSRTKTNELDAAPEFGRGRYYVTKWEFDVATKWGLISDVNIIGVVDNSSRSDFSDFIIPMYRRRRDVKDAMEALRIHQREDTSEYEELKKQDLFLKYLLNNSYGKFAQNPRNFKEYYYTDAGEKPPKDWMEFLKDCDDETRHKFSMPVERAETFEIWAKPSPGRRFNNVGTASSITGAARAVLLDAMQRAREPIYCDTDSLICRDLVGVDLDVSKLGAWKHEATFDRVIIAGRKLYACEVQGYPDGHEKRIKIRSKGATGLVWRDFEKMLDNEIITTLNKAPTISKTGHQEYLRRNIRATAPLKRKSHGKSDVRHSEERQSGFRRGRNSNRA